MDDRSHRNRGQHLIAAIESVDKGDLPALSQLARASRDCVKGKGFDTSGWPLDGFTEWFLNPGSGASVFNRLDDHCEIQRFVIVHAADHDPLFGVGSRRSKNAVGDRAENVATNLLLDIVPRQDCGSASGFGKLGVAVR